MSWDCPAGRGCPGLLDLVEEVGLVGLGAGTAAYERGVGRPLSKPAEQTSKHIEPKWLEPKWLRIYIYLYIFIYI